ncbi:unnamed protein product [Leuciscus chuanchicus]
MLKSKLNDLEGRSRRNNIRIVGIPEGAEKGRPTEFVAELIKQLFEDFSDPPVIDRAHRVPQPKPPEGAKSRAIIARIHYFQDKERILRLRQGRQLEYQGRKVLFFPDYTAEVMEQRRSFGEVMQMLRELKDRHDVLRELQQTPLPQRELPTCVQPKHTSWQLPSQEALMTVEEPPDPPNLEALRPLDLGALVLSARSK